MPFADDDLTDDGFLGGRLRLLQPRRGYRAATDPVLLAAAVPAAAGETVLDLGCGAGAAMLCLGSRMPGLILHGLELQPDYADLARRNAARNAIAADVHDGDLAAMPAALRAHSFDHVIANPPYYPATGGTDAADPGRARALREATPLALWLEAGLRRLKPGGHFTLIQSADRLADLLGALHPAAGSIAVLPIAPRDGRPAGRVIVQARKGGRGTLRLLAPLIMHDGATHERDGESHTAALRAVLRDAAAIRL